MNGAATAAELFPHIRIVMGMVVGLGITRLLTGVAGIVQHPRRAPVSVIHMLWVLSILVELVLFWWWEFALYEIQDWSFGIFAFLIFYAVTLFCWRRCCAGQADEYDGYEDFPQAPHWFFAIFGLTSCSTSSTP